MLGSMSVWHWLIVLAVVLLLFGGRGKISSLMGDFGKGLKAFKKGINPEDEAAAAPPPAQPQPAPADPGKIGTAAPHQPATSTATDKAA
jgi:sec-independent protein translocase protein TatA